MLCRGRIVGIFKVSRPIDQGIATGDVAKEPKSFKDAKQASLTLSKFIHSLRVNTHSRRFVVENAS